MRGPYNYTMDLRARLRWRVSGNRFRRGTALPRTRSAAGAL